MVSVAQEMHITRLQEGWLTRKSIDSKTSDLVVCIKLL